MNDGKGEQIREKIQAVPIKQSVIQDDLAVLSKEIKRLQMNIMEIQDMAFIRGRDKVDNKCKEIVGDPEKSGSKNIIRQLQQLLDANSSTAAKGLSEFHQYFAPYFKDSIIKMCSTEPISLEELHQIEEESLVIEEKIKDYLKELWGEE